MAYTPINWQTGDTITAEKMNKMDNGWGVSATQSAVILEETVTTVGDSPAIGELAYSEEITEPTVVITLNGVEYTCQYRTDVFGYGDPTFDEYPFVVDYYEGVSELITSTAGTYTLKIETSSTRSVEVSADFVSATAFHATVGVTTFQEVSDALSAGRIVVVPVEGGMVFVSAPVEGGMVFVSALDTLNTPLKIYAVGANYGGATNSIFLANTADSAIYQY